MTGVEVPDADPDADTDTLPLLPPEPEEAVELPPPPLEEVEFPPTYRFVLGAIAAKTLKLYSCVEPWNV